MVFVIHFFVAGDHGLEMGGGCVTQAGQLDVDDDEAA
jgi:hypothetical protein